MVNDLSYVFTIEVGQLTEKHSIVGYFYNRNRRRLYKNRELPKNRKK